MFKVIVKGKEIILGEQVIEARSMFERLRGLMFKNSFEGFDGMMIAPCRSIHTFFMKMSIHVIFLNKMNRVLKIYEDLGPWRVTPIFFNAQKVLEISTEKDISSLEEGDYIDVKDYEV